MNNSYIPKIDLHCHLDGSIPPDVLCELAIERKIKIPGDTLEGYRAYLKNTLSCKSLVEYLERFDFPIAVLQDDDALVRATSSLITMLDEQGLIYVELRFAPQQHTQGTLSQEDALLSVLKAVNSMKIKCSIHVEIICCLMNYGNVSLNEKENWKTVELVKKYYNKGVVLLDIAGAEGTNMLDFEPFFQKAKEYQIPFIMHAGEAGSSNNVKQAMHMGAVRIGHGVRCIEDVAVINALIESQIPLEICVSSNINCFVFDCFANHPVKMLRDKGLLLTINTDNMMFSNTTLDKEYELMGHYFGFTEDDFISFNYNSLRVAGCSEEVKNNLKQRFLTDRLDNSELVI